MEKSTFLDILFDLINESDILDAEILDLCADRDGLTVLMKDGTSWRVTVTQERKIPK